MNTARFETPPIRGEQAQILSMFIVTVEKDVTTAVRNGVPEINGVESRFRATINQASQGYTEPVRGLGVSG